MVILVRYLGPSVVCVFAIVFGSIFAFDIGGVATWSAEGAERWWRAGRVRRMVMDPRGYRFQYRTVGWIMLIMGVLVGIGLVFSAIRTYG